MPKLLLIDDDEELCAELKELLTVEGFYIEIALDGPNGLQRATSGKHDLIILDLKLPGMNGYDVLKAIRGTDPAAKVMVLSGRPMGDPLLKENGLEKQDEEKILSLADAVINKPFMIDDFILKVKKLLVEKSQ